ncbi:MAG TPA: hypothetical protein VKH81_16090 [Candidatus Angelobacter sp.]|nr:hypothetical protein [Candidatus Angelobacter sp.]
MKWLGLCLLLGFFGFMFNTEAGVMLAVIGIVLWCASSFVPKHQVDNRAK